MKPKSQINLWFFPPTCPLGAVFQTYGSAPSLTPDDDVFRHLSLTYANNHAKMSRGVACKSQTPAFENGITNGAAWYPLTGGMQDYNYVWYGCMEVTLEISCCKFPPAYELKKYWDDNQLVRATNVFNKLISSPSLLVIDQVLGWSSSRSSRVHFWWKHWKASRKSVAESKRQRCWFPDYEAWWILEGFDARIVQIGGLCLI